MKIRLSEEWEGKMTEFLAGYLQFPDGACLGSGILKWEYQVVAVRMLLQEKVFKDLFDLQKAAFNEAGIYIPASLLSQMIRV